MTLFYPYEFLKAGIGIIPVQYRDKAPDHTQLPKVDGHATWEPFKTQLPTAADLNKWFSAPRNYGVVAGWMNLMILDFDDAGEYTRWRLWASKTTARFAAENAFQVQTSRGVHVYLRCEIPGANRKVGKIDVKFKGYVLGPGSIHPSGAEYRALKSVLFFPVISHLSDILPAELLETSNLPSQVKTAPLVISNDPWQSAMESSRPAGIGAVEKIKKAMRIEDFFSELHPTSRDGRWQITCCPFHDDKHPSFWVDTEQQICGCFAGCTPKPLDVIGLHSKLYGLSNGEAIRLLAKSV